MKKEQNIDNVESLITAKLFKGAVYSSSVYGVLHQTVDKSTCYAKLENIDANIFKN